MWDEQDAFVFASFPLLRVDLPVVCITQIDSIAAFFRDAGCKGYLDARPFNTAGCIVCACSLDMRTMGENAAREIFESLPLFEKIIPHVIANLVDKLPMRVGDLGDMRRIDNDLASISNSWFCFVHSIA